MFFKNLHQNTLQINKKFPENLIFLHPYSIEKLFHRHPEIDLCYKLTTFLQHQTVKKYLYFQALITFTKILKWFSKIVIERTVLGNQKSNVDQNLDLSLFFSKTIVIIDMIILVILLSTTLWDTKKRLVTVYIGVLALYIAEWQCQIRSW